MRIYGFKKRIARFLTVAMLVNLFMFTNMFVFPEKSFAAFHKSDANNGEWTEPYVVRHNTEEAQIMVRVGDIDNFGQKYDGKDYPFYDKNNHKIEDPFDGTETRTHGYPHKPENDDPIGTDMVMVPSGFKYHNGRAADGYADRTARTIKNGFPANNVRPIVVEYKEEIEDVYIRNAYIQMFVDDFQPKRTENEQKTGYNGNTRYEVYLIDYSGDEPVEHRVTEIETLINNINQHGPIGKVITFDIPERFLDVIRTGKFGLKFDDSRPNAEGDGHAIDFVKVLINLKKFSNEASVTGVVKSEKNKKPIQGATVTAGGLSAITNAQGRYLIEGIPPGQVIVTATMDEYKGKSVTLKEVVAGGSYEANFELKEAPRPETPEITYTPMEETYKNVQVTIDYPVGKTISVIKEYKIDKGEWKVYLGPFYVSENCTISARGTNNEGNSSFIATQELTNLLRSKVDISINDVSGLRDQFVTKSNNKRVDKVNDKFTVLVGDSKANISVIGRDVNYFRYKFIETNTKPQTLPTEGWKEFDLDSEDNEDDVVLDKQGFLNQRSYNVNHLGTMSSKSRWEDRSEVYKNPFAATELKSAARSTNKEDYGSLQKILLDDGTEGVRWVNKTIFVDQMSIYSGDDYDYKEASKFWGYMKVDRTGEYLFGSLSDDGLMGMLTINNKQVKFADDFSVHSAKFHKAEKSIHLEKDKYYPVYMEYFNWGGWAAFVLKYKFNPSSYDGTKGKHMDTVPKSWFYPSVNIAPGEFAETIFQGTKGIKFPEASGDYYIAYQTGMDDGVSREGVYGPFTVNGKSDIKVVKEIENGNKSEAGQRVYLQYKIKPGDVKVRSTFMENGEYKDKIKLQDIRIKDTLPAGVDIYEFKGAKGHLVVDKTIEMTIPDLEYTLTTTHDGKKVYTAEDMVVSVCIGSEIEGNYSIGNEDSAVITFTDVNNAKRQLGFDPIELVVSERSKAVTDISREIDTTPASEDYSLVYNFNGEEVYYYGGGTTVEFRSLTYSETFPPRIEVVEIPEGMEKSGTFEMGYTVSGKVPGIVMKKVGESGSKYRVNGSFVIKIRSDYPKTYSFNRGSSDYEVSGYIKGTALSNGGELKVTAKRLAKLRVLEIQPGRDFTLTNEILKPLVVDNGEIQIDKMSIQEFIGKIDAINGKYDIVYIGEEGDAYTAVGAEAGSKPQGSGYNNEVEFRAEKDITNRSAELIKEYIQSGQLIMFRKSIFDNREANTEYKIALKLKENFKESQDLSNVKIIDELSEIGENIKEVFDAGNKRPVITVMQSPRDYDDSDSTSVSEKHNMNFIYNLENLNMVDYNENIMSVRLYLDKNGDGFFRDDELVETSFSKQNGKGYSMEYDMKKYFTGMMPWKIEVMDNTNGAKAYQTGFAAYKGEKLKIRVLHLLPKNGTNFSLLSSSFIPSLHTELYDIDITELKISDFENAYPNNKTVGSKTIKTVLNGNYDMIILGFKDVYGSSDLKKPEVVQAVKDFIKTKQSVMFTHDTFMYNVKTPSSGTYNLTRQFRDALGQSRYKDMNNPSGKDFFGNDIVHDEVPLSGKVSYGFTDTAIDRAENSGKYDGNKYDTEGTYKLNESMITKFPFNLPENLEVAKTHYQYFQLNLEDPDVVPHYNLNRGDDDTNKYNSRSFFYTYSKGNLTYSGTGHSIPEGEAEQELFVNTMLKAARNANHAPTLKVINLEEGKVFPKNSMKIKFSFIPEDIDGDEMTGKVFVNDNAVKNYFNGELISGEPMQVEITRGTLMEFLNKDTEEFNIEILVMDTKGAVIRKEYSVKYKDIPYLDLSSSDERGYLSGDRASVTFDIKGVRAMEDINTTISNISYSMNYDANSIGNVSDSSWNDIMNVGFNPEASPKKQSKSFEFDIKTGNNSVIRTELNYKYSNFDNAPKSTKYDYTVATKEGSMRINVINNDKTNFGEASISITYPNGYTELKKTNEFGQLNLDGLKSGRYFVEIVSLPDNYVVNGSNKRTIDLSYVENKQDVVFNMTDTSYASLRFIAETGRDFLVGDTTTIKYNINAYNQNLNVDTEMKNFNLRMEYDKDVIKFTDENLSWNITPIRIKGTEIKNGVQEKDFQLTFAKQGKAKVSSTLEYTVFDDFKNIREIETEFNVRSSRLVVQIEKPNTSLCRGINVEIRDEAGKQIITQGLTDEASGEFVVTNLPTGKYLVRVPDIYDFTIGGKYMQEVYVDYNNHNQTVSFRIETDSIFLNSGTFVNKRFVEKDEVAEGIKAPVATEFKVINKKSKIIMTADEKVEKLSLAIYKFNNYGQLVPVNKNFKVKVLGNDQSEKELLGKGDFDLSGLTGERQIELILPESEEYYNHYVLVHDIHQKAAVGDKINYQLQLNTELGNEKTLDVVELPDLD